ncbi:hypothetical protein BEWA_024810 [Theileria equi strain WA]|uniref:Spindle pole body component n=1 Tax=Theileria equi strain WA TaxID=1537102 RepID=L0AVJ2_THEEQ|nr:hypothetical protein BEWA_024810 [Theileria equi strain WA]AFZ79632.1 hypothetical protein BEWA_024810 [Theileria equi strain WA]|eukprot:XP_004829298.1 hypothetical protein BEWA_024810 [Theileria equi strain WA]
MLHDILLALSGHSGDIIVKCVEPFVGFAVSSEFSLAYSEVDIINSIVKTGWQYKCIKRFCRRVKRSEYFLLVKNLFASDNSEESLDANPSTHIVPSKKIGYYGYYINAMCTGIEKYLEEYLDHLISIENTLISDPTLPLSTFSILMCNQKEIINTLTKIITDYEVLMNVRNPNISPEDLIHSTEIWDTLVDKSTNDIAENVYRNITLCCMEAFKMQLKAWICYGQLLDPHGEFIISKRKIMYGKGLDTDISMYESFYNDTSSEGCEFEWDFRFYIKLPKGCNWGVCSYESAKTILFIGKAVRMLIRKYHNENDLEMSASSLLFDDWNEACTNIYSFSSAIDRYREHVSSMFWTYINESYNFEDMLNLFRNVYLMGHDALFSDFLKRGWNCMLKEYTFENFNKLKTLGWKYASYLINTDSFYNYNTLQRDIGTMLSEGLYRGDTMYSSVASTLLKDELECHGPSIKNMSTLKFRAESDISRDIMRLATSITACSDMQEIVPESPCIYSQFDLCHYVNHFDLKSSQFIDYGSVRRRADGCFLICSYSTLPAPSGIWLEEIIYISNGFETNITVNVDDIHEELTFSIILQSKVDPKVLRDSFLYCKQQPKIDDCLSITFTVSPFEFLNVKRAKIHGEISLGYRGIENTWGKEILTNISDTVQISSADMTLPILFGTLCLPISIKFLKRRLSVKILHEENEMNFYAGALDTTQMLTLDSGNAFIGLLSDLKGASIRIVEWYFYGALAKYDMLPYYETTSFINTSADLSRFHDFSRVGLNEWMYIGFSYKYKWPFSVFITLNRYNSLFQYLLLIRRCVYGLEDLCLINTSMRLLASDKDPERMDSLRLLRKLCLMRARFHIHIKKIMINLHQDIIDVSHRKLHFYIESNSDFQKIKKAHEDHLDHIARFVLKLLIFSCSNCFIKSEQAVKSLLQCIDICFKFTALYQDITADLESLSTKRIGTTSQLLDTCG